MIQSAVLITSMLCSTTSTVLPASTKRCSTPSNNLNVGEMQSCRRLVQQIQRLSGTSLDQLASQLDPLGFASGNVGDGWPIFK